MLARGHYDAKSKFVDDDGVVHKEWYWVRTNLAMADT